MAPNPKIETIIESHWKEYETEPFYDYIADISKGNPGAITALSKACSQHHNPLEFLQTAQKKKDFSGSQVWILFKDECEKDVNCFSQLPHPTSLTLTGSLVEGGACRWTPPLTL